MSLAWIPRGILQRIQQICCKFLWNGKKEGNTFSWVNGPILLLLRSGEGGDLNHSRLFAQALAAKQGWLLLKQNSLWAEVLHYKYIWPLTITNWIRRPNWNRKGISGIWRAILNAMPIIKDRLIWKIGNDASVRIGIDPWPGCENSHRLRNGLVLHLNNRGIKFLSQIGDQQNSTLFSQAWLNEQHWNIPIEWNEVWQRYIHALAETHARLRAGEDELIWALSKSDQYTLKMGHDTIIEDRKPENLKSWWVSLWKLNAPPRTRLLMWNILENKVPTGSYLEKRAFSGPSQCVMCLEDEESTHHLFLTCPTTRTIWSQVIRTLNLNVNWQGADINTAWEQWWSIMAAEKPKNLSLLVSWYIWIKRNTIIFEDRQVNWDLIHPLICAAYSELPNEISHEKPRIIR